MGWVAAAAAVLQVVGSFVQYSEQKKADKAAKNAAYQEAALMEEDAKRAALQQRIDADKARKTQKLLYLTSGVDLEGSPLLVMDETYNQGEENAKNTIDNAASKASLVRQQGSIQRASLFGTIGQAAGQAATGYTNYLEINKQIK